MPVLGDRQAQAGSMRQEQGVSKGSAASVCRGLERAPNKNFAPPPLNCEK